MTPEYHFTSDQLSDYLDKVREAWRAAEVEPLRAAAVMAKTRLDDFADKANAGQVHYSARELKRKIGAAFSDFDLCQQQEQPGADDICAACGSPRREHQPGGTRWGPTTLCGVFIQQHGDMK